MGLRLALSRTEWGVGFRRERQRSTEFRQAVTELAEVQLPRSRRSPNGNGEWGQFAVGEKHLSDNLCGKPKDDNPNASPWVGSGEWNSGCRIGRWDIENIV